MHVTPTQLLLFAIAIVFCGYSLFTGTQFSPLWWVASTGAPLVVGIFLWIRDFYFRRKATLQIAGSQLDNEVSAWSRIVRAQKGERLLTYAERGPVLETSFSKAKGVCKRLSSYPRFMRLCQQLAKELEKNSPPAADILRQFKNGREPDLSDLDLRRQLELARQIVDKIEATFPEQNS
ncbi:hypothetical protein [Rubinisphaera sp.]|uniref:hypothetical protein n=1 Tax=Rubinisphaera sp. TaxID=2024857 RepID=UPI000C10C76E|nr:hypothetical protein [Rubinisphaera sp.]MBV10593.1 hypothetical protein [Rubinisphaera sp.]HCS51823.1 hypothetical protein [Planctomycetaceae bacterium]|tara:strand:- start:306 stop:839 length:534 start_codon:yes stop_codon:yes gene_type:complete